MIFSNNGEAYTLNSFSYLKFVIVGMQTVFLQEFMDLFNGYKVIGIVDNIINVMGKKISEHKDLKLSIFIYNNFVI